MPFTVTVTEQFPDDSFTERLKQTVDCLDLMKVIQAVNTPPPAASKPKATRKDKGVARGPKTTPSVTV